MRQTKYIFLTFCLMAGILFTPAYVAAENSLPSIPYEKAILMLKSDVPDEQYAGIEALARSHDARASLFLIELIQSPDVDGVLKIDAAYALGMRADSTVVPDLINALEREFKERTGIWAGLIPALVKSGMQMLFPFCSEH